MKTSRMQHIDVWRCVAIASVLTAHVLAFSHPWYKTVLGWGAIWRIEALSLLGVKIFFCISGYVICRGMVRESTTTGRVDMAAFYRRRAYRILPPLFIYLAAVALLTATGVLNIPAYQFAQTAAFLCNIAAIGSCAWALGHAWSLAYEEQFYVLFPLLFASLLFATHRKRILVVIGLVAIGCCITYLARMVLVNVGLSYVLCMLSGCACALYWDKLAPLFGRLPLRFWIAAVLCIPASCCFAAPAIAGQVIFPIVLPVILCVAVFGTPVHHPKVRNIFENNVLAHIGRISYGIYLWQQLATADYGFTSPAPTFALLAGACLLAHYSFVYFELPLMKRASLPASAGSTGAAATLAASLDDQLAKDPTNSHRLL